MTYIQKHNNASYLFENSYSFNHVEVVDHWITVYVYGNQNKGVTDACIIEHNMSNMDV